MMRISLCCVFYMNDGTKLHFVPNSFFFFLLHGDLLVYCSLLGDIYKQIYSNYLLSAAGELVDILLYISPPGAISTSDAACSVPPESA